MSLVMNCNIIHYFEICISFSDCQFIQYRIRHSNGHPTVNYLSFSHSYQHQVAVV